MTIEIVPIACLADNYAYLICDHAAGEAAAIDPAEAAPVAEALAARQLTLTHILNTHHHHDHVDGNLELKARSGARVIGAAADRHRLPGLDLAIDEATQFALFGKTLRIFDTPGHTMGGLSFGFADNIFTGDTLFVLGCGRLFEGTPAAMLTSLKKLAALPDATKIYCGHEYASGNARFALCIDPTNPALQHYARDILTARAEDKPSVPSTIGAEKAANPFLRCHTAEIRAALNLPDASETDIFAELRRRKDAF